MTSWMAGAWRRVVSVAQFFWPWLEKRTPEQEQDLRVSLKRDEARIAALDLSKMGEVALEEARRLADSESERRRGTDQKAATYLPLVAALIPLVLTVVSALWEKKAGGAPVWLNMLLLALAVSYTASAGSWAFKELRVSVSHEPGLADFERAWAGPHPNRALTRRLLLHTRRNREGVNWKVTCIIMAHEYLLRAFLTFSVLLLLNIGWYLAGLIGQSLSPVPGPTLKTPRETIAAIEEVQDLSARLRTIEAWAVLDEDCRRRSAGRAALVFSAQALAPTAKIPVILRPATGEAGAVQDVRFDCAGKAVGRMRAWLVPARLAGTKRSHGLPSSLAVAAITTIVAFKKNWPPTDARLEPAKLPPILLQQAALRSDDRGRPLALTITAVAPGVFTTP